MNIQPPPPVSGELRAAFAECGISLLETQAMPYDWVRLKLKHETKPHPFELDYDGSVESLVNAVEYCRGIVDGVLTKNGNSDEQESMQRFYTDLGSLSQKLSQLQTVLNTKQ